jgi:hypothetical protein
MIAHAPTDLRALLDEVERLTSREEALVNQNVAMMGLVGRLQQQVEQLTAERDNALTKAAVYGQDWYSAKSEFGAARSKMLQHIQEAFREGAIQARDAAATEVCAYDIKVMDPLGRVFPVSSVPLQELANLIRRMPIPARTGDTNDT